MTKLRCKICDKKINSFYKQILTCKCENIFCKNHLSDHQCTYDYKKEYKKLLNKESVVPDKLKDRI